MRECVLKLVSLIRGIIFPLCMINAVSALKFQAQAQWRTLHEILGGRMSGASQDLYVRPMVGGSGGMLPQENFEI